MNQTVLFLFSFRYPPLTLFTLRWLLPEHIQREKYPAIVNIGATLPVGTAVFYTVIFYLIWQLLYYIFIVYGRRDKVKQGLRTTSYTWLLTDKKGFVSQLIRKCGIGSVDNELSTIKILFYFFLQFAYMIMAILPVTLFYYRYK